MHTTFLDFNSRPFNSNNLNNISFKPDKLMLEGVVVYLQVDLETSVKMVNRLLRPPCSSLTNLTLQPLTLSIITTARAQINSLLETQ